MRYKLPKIYLDSCTEVKALRSWREMLIENIVQMKTTTIFAINISYRDTLRLQMANGWPVYLFVNEESFV